MEPSVSYALLSCRVFLRISGEDARAFLQGLITNDIRKVTPAGAVYAALLSPQGKFLHDFFIMQQGNALLLECDAARMRDLQERLMLYRLRSKVEIVSAEGVKAAVMFGTGAAMLAPHSPGECQAIEGGILYRDPRLTGLGLRIAANEEAVLRHMKQHNAQPAPEDAYDAWRIDCGVPEGRKDLIPDKSLLLDYGLDALNAVDYQKGCYVGQEVTARMHYRANLRKGLFIAESLRGESLEADSPVTAGGREIGELRSVRKEKGLALLRTEELQAAEAAGQAVEAGGITLHATPPPWRAAL